MSSQEKRHTSHKASMQHLRFLDSFLDEIDREVMSLTDRAFKSLCIGDEAIYNDSEFTPSPISCHKPLAEEVSKKTQDGSFAVKKQNLYPPNGVNDALCRSNKNSSKESSLFAVFTAKKNGDVTNMTNGDTWDKSALLSIQRELSEFNSDYHSLAQEHLSPGKNNLKSAEKMSANKSSKDLSIPSGKSSKNKHGKNNKLRKLNSINFFLHSEFSPFLSWRDFNKFSLQEHISEIMLSNSPPEWYDLPLYKELTAAHGHYKQHFSQSEEKEIEQSPKQKDTHQPKLLLEPDKSSPPSVPSKSEKDMKHIQHTIITKAPLLTAEQRCNSERTEPCAPWRKNKSRAKSAVSVGDSLINSPACERSKAGEWNALPIKKEVKTIEDQTSTNSTPFSISQLLTPVIPSRHGTGTSEILQAVLSPTALDVPPLPEREIHPSPEIKREGYKSMASSLLFNLKDNRKRVKSMYSPPKFKGLDAAGHSKQSPMPEMSISKDAPEIPEISGAKPISLARQKIIISPMSPLLETADTQTCSPQEFANGGMPDDYLALSLLQAGNGGLANRSSKSNQSPAAYPSLQLYRKPSPDKIHIGANNQIVVDSSSQVFSDQISSPGHSKGCDTESYSPSKPGVIKEPMLNARKHTVCLNRERALESENCPNVILTKPDEQAIFGGTNLINEKLKNIGIISTQKSPIKEPNRQEVIAKHIFSARQNNYIKTQRFASSDDDNDPDNDSSNIDNVLLAASARVQDTNYNDEWTRHSKNTKTKEIREEEPNTSTHTDKGLVQTEVGGPLLQESVSVRDEDPIAKNQNNIISKNVLETEKEQKVKREAFSMKGNTSAKRAIFTSVEQMPTKTTVPLKKVVDVVVDKYDLAKMALEEVIAEREQRKLMKNRTISDAGSALIDRNRFGNSEKPQDGSELSTLSDGQEISKIMRSGRGTLPNTKEGKGQMSGVSAFKTSGQTVQTMSQEETKHGESHVAEVKLARPCKQEVAVGHCQHATEHIKYSERERLCIGGEEINTDYASKGDKVLGHQDKELIANNTDHAMEGKERSDHFESGDIHNLGQCEIESGVEKKISTCKPEVPPRRGRSNSQSDERVVAKSERDKDFKEEGDTPVKTKEMASREFSKVQPSQLKGRGPVKGNVSALKEKYDQKSRVQKYLPVGDTLSKSVEEGLNEQAVKDKITTIIPKLTVSSPESESCFIIHNGTDSENERLYDKPLKDPERSFGLERIGENSGLLWKHNTKDFEKTVSDLTKNRQEIQDNKVNETKEKEEGSVNFKSTDNQNKSKGPCKSYVKDLLSGLLGLSSSEKVKHEGEYKELETFETDQERKDSFTVHDIFGQSESLSSSNDKQTLHNGSSNPPELYLLHEPEQGSQSHLEDLSSKAEACNMKEKEDGRVEGVFQKSIMDSCSFSYHESASNVSDRVVFPSNNVEKGGWVHSLIESAKNLTQISHNHTSAKDLQEMVQPLSQKESLNGLEKGVNDMECIKVYSPADIPVRSPQPNQPEMHLLSPPAPQFTAVKDGKLQVGSLSVSEDEERRSAVSTLSEGMDSYETSGGDTMEENMSSTALTEEAEGSMAPSERSGSACSGNDSHSQSKPPAVPPKTEKGLRRAMKLNTRRIQKAEAKTKAERKGRSSDKSVSNKTERRHHSTDKLHTDRTEPRSHSSDRLSSKDSQHNLEDALEPKTHKSEKHSRHHNGHKNQNIEVSDLSKKLQYATKGDDRKPSKSGVSKRHSAEKLQDHKSDHMNHSQHSNISNDTERLSRSSERYLPRKIEHRTQSLDRYLRNKNENETYNTENSIKEVNCDLSVNGSHHSNTKVLPLRQNSFEHAYAPTTTNIVTQSFPMTQRKLLQDPDSGQYFLVDMPVQVKTKTFFDPETKNYVQLPVQSPESAVRQAKPLEVMSTPPLVLYHGFVPVPVSSLSSQKSIVRTTGSMIPNDDLEDFEPSRTQFQEDFYQKHNAEVHPYIEPVYTSQEHTPEEEIDSVR